MIKTWEDFEKLPIIYKEELIEGFPNEIAKNIEDFNLSTRSSGTSGEFLTLYRYNTRSKTILIAKFK